MMARAAEEFNHRDEKDKEKNAQHDRDNRVTNKRPNIHAGFHIFLFRTGRATSPVS